MSNIFDDSIVEKYDCASKSTILKSKSMRIRVKNQNLKLGDKVFWGIHPENITLLLTESNSENQDENTYFADVDDIVNKRSMKRIKLKLAKHNKIVTAEVPSQFVDTLNLSRGNFCPLVIG